MRVQVQGATQKGERALEKVENANRLDTVRDMRRVAIVCDTVAQIREVARWIVEESGYAVRRYKLGFDPGYKADKLSRGTATTKSACRRGSVLPGGSCLRSSSLRAVYDVRRLAGLVGTQRTCSTAR